MDIQTRFIDNAPSFVVVQLQGRLDIQTSEVVKAALHEAIAMTVSNVIVNFEDVAFIDSVGLSAMVSGLRGAREKNKTLVLIGLTRQTAKVFELTMLNRVFLIRPDLDQALQTIQPEK